MPGNQPAKETAPHGGTNSGQKIDVRSLRRAGAALPEPISFSADDVRTLRESYGISQAVLALYLGTSTAAVTQWELGLRRPTGATAKLLDLIRRKGLAVLA
jgi:putative transcriptional regulator